MAKNYSKILTFGLIILTFCSCHAQSSKDSVNQKLIQETQQSYIDGNAPEKNDFDSLLNQDLEKHFSDIYGPVTVKWEFLRDGPTQSGVSNPKYYLWAKINKGKKLVSEGAVRIEAIDKARFNVTNYVDINQIKDKSTDIYNVFPRAVCERIESRLK